MVVELDELPEQVGEKQRVMGDGSSFSGVLKRTSWWIFFFKSLVGPGRLLKTTF